MKIGYYSHYFSPEIGAPSARINDLSRQWIELGHSVQVITCFPNHPVGKIYHGYQSGRYMYENRDGIAVHRHWTYIVPNKGFIKKTLGHLSYLPSSLLLSHNRMQAPHIVIGTSPTLFAAMAAACAAIRFKVPFIMEIRDLWPAIFVELGVLKNRFLIRCLETLEMALYRQATKVVTVTEAFRHNLINRGIKAEKVITIPNGADLGFWEPRTDSESLRKKLSIKKDCFVVLYIGAHGISHALSRILDTAALLKHEPNIRFIFVGEGAQKAEMIRKTHDLDLKNVIFHDPVDKEGVKEFYALSDVCLVPLKNIPLFETFIPSKMFEAMAMERPIIGGVRGEAADILNNSGAAIVVQPENSAEIGKAIMDLFHDRRRLRVMGRSGREFVTKHYSRHNLAASYLSVMDEALEVYRSTT
jgi:glycosyltransferase involved in cell wall biosynthesis